jgi:NADH-quinone oxidoreductase subunit H
MGPNKVSFIGLIQPLLDAFKLLSKQATIPLKANYFFYNISPFFSLSLSLLIWVRIPRIFNSFSVNYSFLLFYSISSCLVFCVLLAG